MKHIPFFSCFIISIFCLRGQNLHHAYNIILDQDCSINNLRNSYWQEDRILIFEEVFPGSDYVRIHFEGLNETEEIRWLTQQKCILQFQLDRKLTPRTGQPNDPEFPRQYSLKNMKINSVWNYKTDGISPEGDTIAIGIVDNGFNYTIPDIIPNLFKNFLEIPDNRKDDDQNGFIDDFIGYNAKSFIGGDDHENSTHGTQVMSIIGSKGDNGIGITGVNQNIKMVLCSADTEFDLVKCYYYFTRLRRDYHNTNGKKGAYIVSTNCSLGFDGTFPEDFPQVCSAYDTLGKVGIINSVATVNENWDIEVKGDVPGLCPSDYLITVTNLDVNNRKVLDAGYNRTYVDIGANGEGILMYDMDGILDKSSGTSFSSPHVAGSAALLYQFCPKLTALSKTKPDSAALLMKYLLLECGSPNSDLTSLTSTGNQLNTTKSLICLQEYCRGLAAHIDLTPCPNPFHEELKLKIAFNEFGTYKILIYNSLGQKVYYEEFSYGPDDGFDRTIKTDSWPQSVYFVYVEGPSLKLNTTIIKI